MVKKKTVYVSAVLVSLIVIIFALLIYFLINSYKVVYSRGGTIVTKLGSDDGIPGKSREPSNFIGNKVQKKKDDVECPQIVKQYNKSMGGVDLADIMLISLYEIPLKYKRWYLPNFAQLLDITINNSWLLEEKIGPRRLKLLIDHDGGADDAMALFMAFIYEKNYDGPKVVGVTTTHGNVDETQSFVNSQRIFNVAQRHDVPIYRGCNTSLVTKVPTDGFFGSDGLGDLDSVSYTPLKAQPQHAAIAMIELSKKYKDELIVLGLGGLTNIALAVKLDPLFLGRISQLFVAAGNLYRLEGYPDVEFNANTDAEAYQIVVQNSTPEKVTLIPFSQVRATFNISKIWRREVLGKIPSKIMRIQNSYERISLSRNSTNWGLLDPIAMAFVLKPSLVTEYRYSKNGITLCGDDRGVNTNYLTDKEDSNVKLVYSADDEPYKGFLLDVFSSEL